MIARLLLPRLSGAAFYESSKAESTKTSLLELQLVYPWAPVVLTYKTHISFLETTT